jgi:hypothetical protein
MGIDIPPERLRIVQETKQFGEYMWVQTQVIIDGELAKEFYAIEDQPLGVYEIPAIQIGDATFECRSVLFEFLRGLKSVPWEIDSADQPAAWFGIPVDPTVWLLHNPGWIGCVESDLDSWCFILTMKEDAACTILKGGTEPVGNETLQEAIRLEENSLELGIFDWLHRKYYVNERLVFEDFSIIDQPENSDEIPNFWYRVLETDDWVDTCRTAVLEFLSGLETVPWETN